LKSLELCEFGTVDTRQPKISTMVDKLNSVYSTLHIIELQPMGMLTIRRSDVPRYLHKSEFYLSLNDDDNDEISIPEDSFKFNDAVRDEDDLRCLLSTLRFWVATQVPDGLIYFTLTGPKSVWELVAPEFVNELGYLKILSELNSSAKDVVLSVAASSNRVDIVRYLLNNGYTDRDYLAINSALAGGHLECVMLLHSSGFTFNHDSCESAARGGHLSCLVYAHENGAMLYPYIAVDTASAGHVDCLQYAHMLGCGWPESSLVNAACQAGSAPCLRYIHSTLSDNFIFSYIVAEAQRDLVSSGHIDCIRFIHETGVPWVENVA